MGKLLIALIDFNDADLVRRLLAAATRLAGIESNRRALAFVPPYYFSVGRPVLPSSAGWYVIISRERAVYVGTADNLEKRLNSPNGSRDQFGDPTRQSEQQRNFIKKLMEVGLLHDVKVITITELDLIREAGIDVSLPLCKRDRTNIEKLLNIYRTSLTA